MTFALSVSIGPGMRAVSIPFEYTPLMSASYLVESVQSSVSWLWRVPRDELDRYRLSNDTPCVYWRLEHPSLHLSFYVAIGCGPLCSLIAFLRSISKRVSVSG